MKYVQFSKRMVLFVMGMVTVLSGAAMVMLCRSARFDEMVQVVESYIGFASVCFAAYSGNSAVEKYLVRRFQEGSTHGEEQGMG